MPNLDGLIPSPDRPQIIEAKYSSLSEEWGEPGTDEVPERVTVQRHHQMIVAGSDHRIVWVPMLLAKAFKPEFRLYRIQRDNELCDLIETSAVEFWNKYVLAGVAPTDCLPTIDVLKRVRRVPGKTVVIATPIAESWLEAKRQLKAAQDSFEDRDRALKTVLGDAEDGVLEDGRKFSYRLQTQKRIDSDRLRMEYPEAAVQCVKETSFRALRATKHRRRTPMPITENQYQATRVERQAPTESLSHPVQQYRGCKRPTRRPYR